MKHAQYFYHELEPDSFDEMEIKGVHYMSFWVVNIWNYFDNIVYSKHNIGSDHFLFKFYPDGSYRTFRAGYDKSKAKHKERINLANDWKVKLEKLTQKKGKDYFDPSNWELDGLDHAMARYIKTNYPSLVQQNIAYYNQEKGIQMQREAAEKQAAEQTAKQRYLAVQNKMDASASSLRNEGFIKVVVDEVSYRAKRGSDPWIYKDAVSYTDWYIDPANIHYSVGTGKWDGTERYDVLVASVAEDGSVYKHWYVYIHGNDENWAQFQLETNDSPLGRSFDDVSSYEITNFRLAPGQDAHSREGVKYGAVSAVMQSVLNYRNGADMAVIHTESEDLPSYLSPAEFDALPFPVKNI